MVQLLALAAEILALILQMLGIIKEIRGIVDNVVREHIPYFVETAVREAGITLAHPTWGLHAIHDQIVAIPTGAVGGLAAADVADPAYAVYVLAEAIQGDYNLLDTKLDSVLSAIGGLPTPPTPPTDVQNAAAVWAFYPRSGASAGEIVSALWSENANHGIFMAVPLQGNPLFSVEGPWYLDIPGSMDLQVPNPDWADIQTDETILAWLQRTDTANVWIADPNTGAPLAHVGQYNPTGYAWKMRPLFESFPPRPGQAPLPPTAGTALVAPVWPGAALVTMGTPVALVDQLVVDEVMDGVLIEVTTPPSKVGAYRLGGVTLDYGAGRIAFESDDGQLEMWQYLGFRDAIYTPKTMAHASKARLQVLGGAEGTVTPWTVS
jgi:hypothetical protein